MIDDDERFVLDALNVICERANEDECFLDGIKTAKEIIENAPKVDSVKHGKWLEKSRVLNSTVDEWQQMKCSVCGRWHTTPFLYYVKEDNYCPHCGARMDGNEQTD